MDIKKNKPDQTDPPPVQQKGKTPSTGPSAVYSRRYLWILFAWFAGVFLFLHFGKVFSPKITYSRFKKNLNSDNIAAVTIRGQEIKGKFKNAISVGGTSNTSEINAFSTVHPPMEDPELLPLLEKKQVRLHVESDRQSWWSNLLLYMLPWVLIIGFFVYSNRRMQQRVGGVGGGLFGFGRSKARLYTRSDSDVTFRDVAGLNNAKNDLLDIIAYLKEAGKFTRLGGKLPRGVLLAGPPGTGKTLLARATAGEADVPFYSISGSEFIEMFVGVGASRVRDMFNNAKKDAPSIIFIDELDAIGRVRGTGLGGGHDEREQTLNQILTEMDGFAPTESVVVIAATNRPDVLDPALVRPGRFDRRVILELPHKEARLKILRVHVRDMQLSDKVELGTIASLTVGFSGAELENLVNEAALIAGRKNKPQVEAEDFEEGMDKIRMGPEREEIFSDAEKQTIAYHEAGHTLIAKQLPGADPVKKVTIIPHGQAMGVTEQVPAEERHNYRQSWLENRLVILMGGRAAEKTVLDDYSNGASNDLSQATQLARRMVCQWGMSNTLGPVTYPRGEPHPFLGRELAESREFSEDTARIIDEEVRALLRQAEERAFELILQERESLEALADALLEHETLDDTDINDLLAKTVNPTR